MRFSAFFFASLSSVTDNEKRYLNCNKLIKTLASSTFLHVLEAHSIKGELAFTMETAFFGRSLRNPRVLFTFGARRRCANHKNRLCKYFMQVVAFFRNFKRRLGEEGEKAGSSSALLQLPCCGDSAVIIALLSAGKLSH